MQRFPFLGLTHKAPSLHCLARWACSGMEGATERTQPTSHQSPLEQRPGALVIIFLGALGARCSPLSPLLPPENLAWRWTLDGNEQGPQSSACHQVTLSGWGTCAVVAW